MKTRSAPILAATAMSSLTAAMLLFLTAGSPAMAQPGGSLWPAPPTSGGTASPGGTAPRPNDPSPLPDRNAPYPTTPAPAPTVPGSSVQPPSSPAQPQHSPTYQPPQQRPAPHPTTQPPGYHQGPAPTQQHPGAPPYAGRPSGVTAPPSRPESAPPTTASQGLFPDAQVIARVGNQCILAGDLSGQINQTIEQYLDQATPEQLDQLRISGLQQLLPGIIEVKLCYLDFLRTIDIEMLPQIQASVMDQFDEKRLPQMLEDAGMLSTAQLDAYLREYGSSLEKERRAFFERSIFQEMVRRNVDFDREVSHDEMLDYYQQHAAEFAFESQVKWEQIQVRYRNHGGSRHEAYPVIANLGNEILRGAPFEAVAERGSEGPNASLGGQYDWTTQGSHASEQVDHLLFTLPVGQMSRIIEDETSFRILRVIERREAGRTPFIDAQDDIKEAIITAERRVKVTEYLERLREEIPVWTMFDQQADAESASPTAPGRR